MRRESNEIMFSAVQWEQMMECLRIRPVGGSEDAAMVGVRLGIAIGWTRERVCVPVVLQVMHACRQQFTQPVDDLESVGIDGI